MSVIFWKEQNGMISKLSWKMAWLPVHPAPKQKRKKTRENTLPKTNVAPENGGFQ